MKTALRIALMLTAVGCTLSQAQGGVFDGAMARAMAPGKRMGDFHVEKPEAFKGATQVVIGQFSVAFFVRRARGAGGGFASGNASANLIGVLDGLSASDYNAITDAIYADFAKQLEASGVSIVAADGYRANKYYAKVKLETSGDTTTKLELGDDGVGHAQVYWPTALGRNENMELGLRIADGNMANTYTAQYDYARNSKIPVLNVVIGIDFFGDASSRGGAAGGGATQVMTVTQQVSVATATTRATLMSNTGKYGKMHLDTPIDVPGTFANITNQTSGGTLAAETLANVFGRGARPTRTFGYKVTDGPAYRRLSVAAAHDAAAKIVTQLAAMR